MASKRRQKTPQTAKKADNGQSKWKTSDILASIALVVAVGSASLSLLTYNAQFGEKIRVDNLTTAEDHIFPYIMRRDKGSDPYVQSIGGWYLFRLANRSSHLISIIEIKYRERGVGDAPWSDLPGSLAADLRISDAEIKAKKFQDLPLRLDIGETQDLSAFIPLSISNELGRHLFALLREPNHQVENPAEAAMVDPNYFENFEKRITTQLRSSRMGEYLEFGPTNMPFVSVDHPPFMRDSDGNLILRDANNNYNDGFRYRSALTVYNAVNDQILDSKNETIRIQESPSSSLELAFYLSGGSIEYITLYRDKMALNRLRPKPQSQ